MRAMGSQATLDAVYGPGRVQSLAAALGLPPITDLLATTLVVLHRPMPELTTSQPSQHGQSHEDTVDLAIAALLRRRATDNVLALGYKLVEKV